MQAQVSVRARVPIDPASARFAAASGALVVAGGLVAAVNSAAPFAHGSWLAAYLVLVGGVAQAALGLGCAWLEGPPAPERLRGAQLGLWNGGSLLVAAAVLAGTPGLVLAGSVVLLAALVCFGAGAARAPRRARVLAYHAVIAALAVSVVVGSVLASV